MKRLPDPEDAARELKPIERRLTGIALLLFVAAMLFLLPLEGIEYLWVGLLSFPIWGIGVALSLGGLKGGIFSSKVLYVLGILMVLLALIPVEVPVSARSGLALFSGMVFVLARSRKKRERGGWV